MSTEMQMELNRRVRQKAENAYRGAVARHGVERSEDSLQALFAARDSLLAVANLTTSWCKAA